jgi:hypothetical protein
VTFTPGAASSTKRRPWAAIAAAVVVVAASATTADWVWYTFGVRHRMTAGVLHGALLLTVVGGALGALTGKLLKGLPIGAIAGIGGALSYYLIASMIDRRPYGVGIPAAWVTLWLFIAVLDGRWLRAPAPRPWGEIVVRGLAAAVLGGVAFFLVVGTLWGSPPPTGRNYAIQFLAWAVAWAPGIVSMSAGPEQPSSLEPSRVEP